MNACEFSRLRCICNGRHAKLVIVMGDEQDASREVACAIGELAIESARLERLTTTVIGWLLCSDIGTDVVGGQSWNLLASMCATLVASRAAQLSPSPHGSHPLHDEALQQLPELVARANELMRKRNELVHGAWFFTTDVATGQVEVETLRVKAGRPPMMATWTLDQIRKVHEDLEHVTDEMGRYAEALRDLCPRLRHKPKDTVAKSDIADVSETGNYGSKAS